MLTAKIQHSANTHHSYTHKKTAPTRLVMPHMPHLADIPLLLPDNQARYKRPPFSLQKVAFCNAIDGLSPSKRPSIKNTSICTYTAFGQKGQCFPMLLYFSSTNFGMASSTASLTGCIVPTKRSTALPFLRSIICG